MPDLIAAAPSVDLVVVGCGAAGLATAVKHLQTAPGSSVVVLERTTAECRGGNTAWTGAFFRLDEDGTPSDDFVDRMRELSRGRSDDAQITTLAENAKATIDWLVDTGVEFETRNTYFLTAKGPRLMPAGGGDALIRRLSKVVQELGGEIRYETSAVRLAVAEGAVSGVVVRDPEGEHTISATSVVLACGGFEGSKELLTEHLGDFAEYLPTISPGGKANQGEGIEMALAVGADRAGQYERFHGEPVDPRSRNPEALVMAYPHGILVNGEGTRFLDEAGDTPDNTFEDVAFQIWRDQQQTTHLVADQKIFDIPGLERSMLTDRGPLKDDTLSGLAKKMSVTPEELERTVAEFNDSVQPGEFDPTKADGKRTEGITPPKSNWARPIDEPPYVAWPVSCAITFTFGGIRANANGQVLNSAGEPLLGLYAAGEIVGLYHHRYPGATSVLRALTFGALIGAATASASAKALTGSRREC